MRWLAAFAALALMTDVIHAAEPVRLELPGIEHAFDLGGGVFSGGSPVGDAAFAELARRGVKTIVSVDGARPDVAAARRAGLRYVHLPIGYDGIPAAQAAALATLAATLPGGIFLHCHHGRHRGPAAAAIVCAVRDGWTAERGEAWLRVAGTSADYAGLDRSVREFQPPTADALKQIPADFPEIAPTPPVVDAMVAIDEHCDALRAAQSRGWSDPPDAAAAALWEHFRELTRAETDAKLRLLFSAAEQAAAGFRDALQTAGNAAQRDAAWKRVTASCTDCHREQRNARAR